MLATDLMLANRAMENATKANNAQDKLDDFIAKEKHTVAEIIAKNPDFLEGVQKAMETVERELPSIKRSLEENITPIKIHNGLNIFAKPIERAELSAASSLTRPKTISSVSHVMQALTKSPAHYADLAGAMQGANDSNLFDDADRTLKTNFVPGEGAKYILSLTADDYKDIGYRGFGAVLANAYSLASDMSDISDADDFDGSDMMPGELDVYKRALKEIGKSVAASAHDSSRDKKVFKAALRRDADAVSDKLTAIFGKKHGAQHPAQPMPHGASLNPAPL